MWKINGKSIFTTKRSELWKGLEPLDGPHLRRNGLFEQEEMRLHEHTNVSIGRNLDTVKSQLFFLLLSERLQGKDWMSLSLTGPERRYLLLHPPRMIACHHARNFGPLCQISNLNFYDWFVERSPAFHWLRQHRSFQMQAEKLIFEKDTQSNIQCLFILFTFWGSAAEGLKQYIYRRTDQQWNRNHRMILMSQIFCQYFQMRQGAYSHRENASFSQTITFPGNLQIFGSDCQGYNSRRRRHQWAGSWESPWQPAGYLCDSNVFCLIHF